MLESDQCARGALMLLRNISAPHAPTNELINRHHISRVTACHWRAPLTLRHVPIDGTEFLPVKELAPRNGGAKLSPRFVAFMKGVR